jgi:hypothetical protein
MVETFNQKIEPLESFVEKNYIMSSDGQGLYSETWSNQQQLLQKTVCPNLFTALPNIFYRKLLPVLEYGPSGLFNLPNHSWNPLKKRRRNSPCAKSQVSNCWHLMKNAPGPSGQRAASVDPSDGRSARDFVDLFVGDVAQLLKNSFHQGQDSVLRLLEPVLRLQEPILRSWVTTPALNASVA